MVHSMPKDKCCSAKLPAHAHPLGRWLICLLPFLVGCHYDSNKDVLRVWDWWSPVEGESTKEYFRGVEATFEQQNPNIDLRFQHIPFGPQYIQKIMASVAARRPPDCLHASIIWANDLYERGVLMDLRPFIEKTPEMADSVWLPAALRYGRDGEYVYGIPIEHDASCILYNLDLFEEAGIPTAPDAFSNWEDFRQAAIRLTKRDKDGNVIQAGFIVSGFDIYAYLPWMYSNGGRFYSDDFRKTAFNDVPLLEAMHFLQDLQHRDRVSFPITAERQDFQLFLQGKAAMIIGGTWSANVIRDQSPQMRFGMMSFPQGPHGNGRGGMTWTNLFCIPKSAANPEQAWKFITYYCGLENAVWKLRTLNRNSPLAALYETQDWKNRVKENPFLDEIPKITEIGGLFPVVRFTEMESILQPLCQGVILNNLTPEDALSEAQKKVDAILTRYYAELERAYK